MKRASGAVDRGEMEIVTSAIMLLEVLVVPYRAGKVALAECYEQLLTRASHLRLVDIDRQQLPATAQLRAVHGVRTPDALQPAARLATRATTMIINDAGDPVPLHSIAALCPPMPSTLRNLPISLIFPARS